VKLAKHPKGTIFDGKDPELTNIANSPLKNDIVQPPSLNLTLHYIPELKARFNDEMIHWIEVIRETQDRYIVPRINFNNQYKLKRGLSVIYQDLTSMLERYQCLNINEYEWNVMIEFCFAKITEFVGKTIGIDRTGKEHVARANKNPRKDKPDKKEMEEKELLMSAKEYTEIRNEFDAEEITIDNLYTTIFEYIELAKEEDLDNPKLIKMNKLVELKQKLKFTHINLDPISIGLTDTQTLHLDWKRWKEDDLQDCKNKRKKDL
jgi:hypothetical protein